MPSLSLPALHRCHISSCCEDDQVYVHAISDARCVFDMGVSNPKYVDVACHCVQFICCNFYCLLSHAVELWTHEMAPVTLNALVITSLI